MALEGIGRFQPAVFDCVILEGRLSAARVFAGTGAGAPREVESAAASFRRGDYEGTAAKAECYRHKRIIAEWGVLRGWSRGRAEGYWRRGPAFV